MKNKETIFVIKIIPSIEAMVYYLTDKKNLTLLNSKTIYVNTLTLEYNAIRNVYVIIIFISKYLPYLQINERYVFELHTII